jgi:hypothetical protein
MPVPHVARDVLQHNGTHAHPWAPLWVARSGSLIGICSDSEQPSTAHGRPPCEAHQNRAISHWTGRLAPTSRLSAGGRSAVA